MKFNVVNNQERPRSILSADRFLRRRSSHFGHISRTCFFRCGDFVQPFGAPSSTFIPFPPSLFLSTDLSVGWVPGSFCVGAHWVVGPLAS